MSLQDLALFPFFFLFPTQAVLAQLIPTGDAIEVEFDGADRVVERSRAGIAHAPQLRIYAVSDLQARADQIVELGLCETDGLLRQLERALT